MTLSPANQVGNEIPTTGGGFVWRGSGGGDDVDRTFEDSSLAVLFLTPLLPQCLRFLD